MRDWGLIKALEENGYSNVYGVEIGKSRAEIALHNFPKKIFHGDEDKVDFLSKKIGKFDVIYSNHVFEHLPNPLLVLKKLKRALKTNGILVLSVPAPGSENLLLAALFYPHFHCYSPQSIQILLNKINLSAFVWNDSMHQLAVLGIKEKSNLNNKNKYIKIETNPIQTIKKMTNWLNDGIRHLNIPNDKETAIGFCHPKTNFINKKSGLIKLSYISFIMLKIQDISFEIISKFLPKKGKLFLQKIYRSIFYRLKLFPTVDIMYLKKHSQKEFKGSRTSKITFFSAKNRSLLSK